MERRKRYTLAWIIGAVVLLVALGVHFFTGAPKTKAPPPGEPVAVVPVVLQDVPVYIDATEAMPRAMRNATSALKRVPGGSNTTRSRSGPTRNG